MQLSQVNVQNRISTSFSLYLILFALIPLGVVVTFALLQVNRTTEQQAVEQRELVVDSRRSDLLLWLETAQTSLNLTLADRTQNQRMVSLVEVDSTLLASARPTTRNNVIRFLNEQLSGQPAFSEIFAYSMLGEVQVSTDAEFDPNNPASVANQPYFQPSIESQTAIHPPVYDPATGLSSMVITIPIVDTEGQRVGVLAGQINMEALGALMSAPLGSSDSGETYLVSRDQNLLLTPTRFEGYALEPGYESQGIEAALGGDAGSATYTNYRGEEVIGAYRWIPELNAAIIAEIEKSEALATSYQIRNLSIALSLLAVLLAAVLGTGLARQITRPIERLTQTAQAIQNGDLELRAEYEERNDEIGVLARAFNSMTEQLSSLIDSLEERVNARTRDLQIAADVSRQITTVLNIDALLNQVVLLTNQGFNFYSTAVFLMDEAQNDLILTAGSNPEIETIGKNIRMATAKSIVAEAARTRQVVLANDVSQSPHYVAVPELPHTQSEIAIPMILGEQLLGVFDVQATETYRFTDEDVKVLTTLAEQTVIAVRNAQLFQDTRKAQESAERANTVKSQFLASVSHELRTPLNAILNFTKFVSSSMLGPVNEEQIEVLDKVVNSGKHLLSLINDVLDISKIEAGSLKLFVEHNINLYKEIEPVIDTAKSALIEKPVELVLDFEEGIPLLSGDKRRIRQIMLNLVSNACKFTDEGKVTLRLYRENGSVVFSVKDTGPGIAPEEHETIFETFRQTHTGLRKGEGTGLGLAISRRLTEAHLGRIWVESQVGQGATFYVSLPLVAEKVTAQPVTEGAAEHG